LIARQLNAEGVKPPRGRYWQPGALTGSNNRHNGILGNEIYAGRLVWNKVRMIKDPETGKRVSRPNPESAWERADAPHLAIVTVEQFRAAEAIRGDRRRSAPVLRRQPRSLLSGLLRCGTCGGGMSSKGADRGGTRIICTAFQNAKACGNGRSYYQHHIEETVLAGLRRHLVDPRAIRHFLKVYHEERKRLAGNAVNVRATLERRLGEVTRKGDRAMDLMLESEAPVASFAGRIKELDREKRDIEAELASLSVPVSVIALHPAAQEHYLQVVENLAKAIRNRSTATDMAQSVRELIESVVVHRTEPSEPIRLKVNGRLAALIGEPVFPDGSMSGVNMVAGEGLEPPTPGL
jgi:site-specific DNA recombinase